MYWIYKGFGNNLHQKRHIDKLESQIIENVKLDNILRTK
jgi:hypothetical protein